MQLVWAERSYPITGGIALSILFHVLLALLIIFGVPSFFAVEVIPEPPGIEATIVSDITAAPKTDKAGKLQDKPKPPTPPAPEQKKPEPPKPAPPATPSQSSPPPAAAPTEAVTIPDETKKAEEKKKEEKKPEEKKVEKKPDEKPKPKKEEQDFSKLLTDLTKNQPAPDTQEKPKQKAKPAPAEPTTGPQTAMLTDGPPMTANENSAIAAQLVPCWNFDAGVPNPENYSDIVIRITVREDGVITQAQLVDTGRLGDPTYRSVADTALRTVLNPSCNALKLPQGKYWPQMDIVFDLAKAINGGY
jgi:outer membrane biosynthesis protein TonB